jgi:molybdopterin converting factor small subunit
MIFGQIVDITGTDKLTIEDVSDTNELINKLHLQYPSLINSKYAVAVDKKIIQHNTSVSSNNTVALLPPFSGG